MSALLFCLAGLFAGASSEQVYGALAPLVLDGVIIAGLVIVAGHYLWQWVLAWRSAMAWLRT